MCDSLDTETVGGVCGGHAGVAAGTADQVRCSVPYGYLAAVSDSCGRDKTWLYLFSSVYKYYFCLACLLFMLN